MMMRYNKKKEGASVWMSKLILLFLFLFLFHFGCKKINDENNNEEDEPDNPTTITIYVSETGNDSNNGYSKDAPFRTIKKAFNKVNPGETISILPGIYYESLEIDNIGDTGAQIVIKGDDKENIPIIDGQRQKKMGFWISNSRNLLFSDLAIRNFTDIGIGCEKCTTISMKNLVVYENGFKVQLIDWELEGYGIALDSSDDLLIEKCNVYANGPNPQTQAILMGTGINMY
jgi:hypothetical protein